MAKIFYEGDYTGKCIEWTWGEIQGGENKGMPFLGCLFEMQVPAQERLVLDQDGNETDQKETNGGPGVATLGRRMFFTQNTWERTVESLLFMGLNVKELKQIKDHKVSAPGAGGLNLGEVTLVVQMVAKKDKDAVAQKHPNGNDILVPEIAFVNGPRSFRVVPAKFEDVEKLSDKLKGPIGEMIAKGAAGVVSDRLNGTRASHAAPANGAGRPAPAKAAGGVDDDIPF